MHPQMSFQNRGVPITKKQPIRSCIFPPADPINRSTDHKIVKKHLKKSVLDLYQKKNGKKNGW